MRAQILVGSLLVLSVIACGGGQPPPPPPTGPVPTATTAPIETAVPTATAAPVSTAPAATDAPKHTFAVKDFAVGMVVEFARNSRHQALPLKDGKPGKATVSEKMLGGTVTVKEMDAAKKSVTAAEVSFLATSTEAPAAGPLAKPGAAAFYAGKKFLVKKGATGLDISDAKGKPALTSAMEISFIASIVSQVVPFATYGYGHGLAAKLGGRTMADGDKADDLTMAMPTTFFSKNRTSKLASVKDGVASFELRGEDTSETENKEGAVVFKGASQGDATVLVPIATSQWTSLRVKRASQTESVKSKSEYTWESESTLTRTFK